MKRFYIIFILFILLAGKITAQSDNCATPTPISVTANCTSPTGGTTLGATASAFSGCVGNADDDVWYQFTATANNLQINVVPSSGMDPVVQLFSGTCASLTTLSCQDVGAPGQAETIYPTGLTNGSVYLVRVYNYGSGSGTGNFTICVTAPPASPANNFCTNATSLAVNTLCSTTSGTTVGATESTSGCAGIADDDVWYKFVATNTTATITVNPSNTMDAVVQLYSGTCSSPTSLKCADNALTNGNEVINALALIVGNTYFIRVYDYYGGNGGGTFTICVTGPPSSSVPTNDAPCNAIMLPAVTADCNYSRFTTTGATASTSSPTPTSCVGGGSPQQGGFTSSSKDVWFKVVAPSNGKLTVTPEPGYGITDGVMVLYSGTCSALSQIACSDDNNYPGTGNDLKPHISKSGLTPGATYFIRYFGFGTSSGNFGICVSSPTNDQCSNALYICNLNGFSGSTSAAYTEDRPCNMYGNNETHAGVDQVDGINTGGIFGSGGSWGSGSSTPYITIQNNSWIRFTAAATTAVLNVTIGDCWVGNYPQGGVQMQIFSGNGCCNFVPVSNFNESSSNFTITANSLTIGNDYYIMVDGYSGDICSYTISANTGVMFPAITAVPNSVCFGQSTTLTGPSGASSYSWSPGGQTTQSITISPSSTITYTCIASGVCGTKQTLTKTIVVNPRPTVAINSGNIVSVCNGSSVNLTATGASTYSWNINSSAATVSVSPTTPTTYTVIGTNGSGCKDTATTSVSINPVPTVTVNSGAPSNICNGSSVSLSASGTPDFVWNTGATTSSITVSPTSNATYTVTGTDANGCSSTATSSVTVNQLPVATATNTATGPNCDGQTLNLTSSGGISYSWTGPNSFVSSAQNLSIPNTTTSMSGVYTVTVTDANGCTADANTIVTIFSTPAAVLVSDMSTCTGAQLLLVASGPGTINWYSDSTLTTLVEANSYIHMPVIPTGTTATYYVTGTSADGCESAAAPATVSNFNIIASATASAYTGNTPITVDFMNTSIGVDPSDNFLWIFGDGNTDSTFDATNNYINGGSYNVILVVTETSSGCVDTAFINVIYENSAILVIPNIFTPNGDGTNDIFGILTTGIQKFHGEIYDRWGVKMYNWDTVQGGWDGRTKSGVAASEGTYFFMFEAEGSDGSKFAEQGAFQLTR